MHHKLTIELSMYKKKKKDDIMMSWFLILENSGLVNLNDGVMIKQVSWQMTLLSVKLNRFKRVFGDKFFALPFFLSSFPPPLFFFIKKRFVYIDLKNRPDLSRGFLFFFFPAACIPVFFYFTSETIFSYRTSISF